MAPGVLYTIGPSNHELSDFADLLIKFKISHLADVRSIPFSRHASSYNRDFLKSFLTSKNIKYVYMGVAFGARPRDPGLYTKDGYLDFEKACSAASFRAGAANIIKGLNSGHNIALMCSEKDPLDCHSAIMVARAFTFYNVKPVHVLHDGSCLTQEDLDKRLLDLYFPDWRNGSLFADVLPYDDLLRQAYRKRNKKIGYHLMVKNK